MQVKFTVTDTDKGFKRLRRRFEDVQRAGYSAQAGIFGKEGDQPHGELTNAQLGAVHEFGTAQVPSRSFMRESFDANRSKYLSMFATMLYKVYEDPPAVVEALRVVAKMMAQDMKDAIRAGLSPKLVRGDRNPLYKTRQLFHAIKGRVARK